MSMKMKQSTLINFEAARVPAGALGILQAVIYWAMGWAVLAIVMTVLSAFLLLSNPFGPWLDEENH